MASLCLSETLLKKVVQAPVNTYCLLTTWWKLISALSEWPWDTFLWPGGDDKTKTQLKAERRNNFFKVNCQKKLTFYFVSLRSGLKIVLVWIDVGPTPSWFKIVYSVFRWRIFFIETRLAFNLQRHLSLTHIGPHLILKWRPGSCFEWGGLSKVALVKGRSFKP